MRRSRINQTLVWSATAIVATAATALVATDAEACFGTPRPVRCTYATTLFEGSPPVTIIVPVGVTTAIVPFTVGVSQSGPVPPCGVPVTTTVTMTAAPCVTPAGLPAAPTGAGALTFPTPTTGFYVGGAVTLTFPGPGPTRSCLVTGTATTTWSNGVTTTGTGDTVICLVDPAPGDPSKPRLDLQHLTPEIQFAHPGDQVEYRYRITNNDPTESVELMLTADSEQAARMGGIAGVAGGSGDGTRAIADPGGGDNFPIAFLEDLVPEPGPGFNYILSDGTGEAQVGLGNEGSILWLNQFTVQAGQEIITKVGAAFGTIPNGTEYSALLYDDPNDDGDPSDAVLLSRIDGEVTDAGSGNFEEVKMIPTPVGSAGDSYFVGIVMQNIGASDQPALLDEDSDLLRSWAASSDDLCDINTEDLTDNPQPVVRISDAGLPGNFLIRAQGVSGVLLGWLDLPPDPPGFPVPVIARSIKLCPGESREVCIVSRSWGGCPPGSACESRVELSGTYSDGTDALACAGSAHIVDDAVPPALDCPDSSRRLEVVPKGEGVALVAELPDYAVSECVQVGVIDVFSEASGLLQPFPPQIEIFEDSGRIVVPMQSAKGGPAALPGLPFGGFIELHMNSAQPLIQTEIVEMMLVGPPAPLQPTYHSFKAKADVHGVKLPPDVEAFLHAMFQLSIDGQGPGGQHQSARIQPDTFQVDILDPERLGVSFQGVFPGGVTGGPIDTLSLVIDVGGAAGGVAIGGGPPCPQDLDGSGDVGFIDLTTVLASWGPCPGCPADFDGDGVVGFTELIQILAAWGPCP